MKKLPAFSLTEVLVTIGIASILVLMAVKYVKESWLILLQSLTGTSEIIADATSIRSYLLKYEETSTLIKRGEKFYAYNHLGEKIWETDETTWMVEARGDGKVFITNGKAGLCFPEFQGVLIEQ